MGISTRIRLQHLQNLSWSGVPITEAKDKFVTPKNQSLLNDILNLSKAHGLAFKVSNEIRESLIIRGGSVTIEEILREENCYSQYRKSLRVRKLLFLEQLISYNGKRLLCWQEITGNERRGPKPGWFKQIENKIVSDTITRNITDIDIQNKLIDRFNTCQLNINKESGEVRWVAICNPNNTSPLLGRRRRILNENEFIMEHYIRERDDEGREKSILNKCTGCAYGDINLTKTLVDHNVCLMKVGTSSSVNINVIKSKVSCRITPDRSTKLRLRSEIAAIREGLDSIGDSQLLNTLNTLQTIPSIYIDNSTNNRTTLYNRYTHFWWNKEIQTDLDQIRESLSNSGEIEIYTDGSLLKEGDNDLLANITRDVTMGCGWVATGTDGQRFLFKGKVENFASSTRAELMAILTAIYATPRYSKLTLFTDSQAAIDAIKLVYKNPKKCHTKVMNWPLLKTIVEITTIQEINLKLVKVKAHSGVELNELADKLAGEGHNCPSCTFDLGVLTSVNVIGCWNSKSIEEPLRKFTKKLGATKQSAQWRLLNRNVNTISETKSKIICWESTWQTAMLSYKDKLSTSNEETRQRAFNVKLLNNELPTLVKMRERFPKVYKDDICVRCKFQKEDQFHIFACSKNSVDIEMCRNKFIEILIERIINDSSYVPDEKTRGDIENLGELCITLNANNRDPEAVSFSDIVIGLIPRGLIELVRSMTGNKETTNRIIRGLMEKFRNYIHKNIWSPRCKEIKSWELSCGIKSVRKRKILTTNGNTNSANNDDNNNNNNNNNYNDNINKYNKIETRNICNHIVSEYLIKVVQGLVNWTDIYRIGFSAGP